MTALAGVMLGTLCSRPIIGRTAWALLFAVVLDLADVVVPNGPPTRQILVLFNQTHPSQLALDLLLVAIETVAIGAVMSSLQCVWPGSGPKPMVRPEQRTWIDAPLSIWPDCR